MKKLIFLLCLLGLIVGAFGFGLYSAIKKNAAFDAVVAVARAAKSVAAGGGDEEETIVRLDFSDHGLVDTNLLPFRRTEVRVSVEDGRQQQMVAVTKSHDDKAFVLSQKGLLFELSVTGCGDTACLEPAGRVLRADGSAMDDIYDLLAVPTEDGISYFISFGQVDPEAETKAFYLARLELPETPDPQGEYTIGEVIFESTPFTLKNGHAHVSGGGGLVYDPARNRVVFTIGDFGLNGLANRYEGDIPPAQDPASDLGKIHAIDLATRQHEVISIGHRNPQGLTLTQSGELISTEHGPKGGDEVNIILPGANYGWPYVSFGTEYEQYTFPAKPLDPTLPHGGFQPPLTAFVPSVGVSALLEARGLHEAWDGDLLVGSLKAQSLFRIRRWQGGFYTEQIHVGDRVRDLEILGGNLVIASDSGKVILFKPLDDLANLRTGIGLVANKNALSRCGQCHNLSYPRSTEYAPHLVNVVSRPVASLTDFPGYSDGLKSKSDEVWTLDNIEAFLRDPQGFAPDSGMPNVELSDAEVDEILELLPLLR